MTRFQAHQIVSIRPVIATFDDFTVYRWTARTKDGASLEIELFHNHDRDSLVYHPTHHLDHTTPKQEIMSHEDV